MKKLFIYSLFLTMAAFMTNAAIASENIKEENSLNFSFYGDLRLRQEAFDNIPWKNESPSITRNGNNNYFRIRPRIGTKISYKDIATLNIRLTNEFRKNLTGPKSYEFPDELILDNFNLSLKGLFNDSTDLIIGRQDVRLGTGKLFTDGTAKDGSRSSYFDGIRLTTKIDKNTKLDLFAFYTQCENDYVIGNEHRDVTGYSSGYNSMDEATAGLFLTNTDIDSLEIGTYYIWKHDTSWTTKSGDKIPNEDIHTFGLFLKPSFTESLSGEFEYAYQTNSRDTTKRSGNFLTTSLKYSPNTSFYTSANLVYISGDNQSTEDKDESFNILFGRFPWISELLIFAYDADGVGTWNNLIQCYLEAGYTFNNKQKVKLTAGPIYAEENNGAGGGHFRGFLGTLKYSLPISKNINTYVLAEVFEPGDYYISDKLSYFLRWEIFLSF